MYTKTTFEIDSIEYTRLYLTGLPYYSKFDSQHVQTLDNVLTDLTQNGTESVYIETVSTDDAIETYTDIWDKTIHYRFFFLYINSRYQLYIVRPYSMSIKNGVVLKKIPSCKVLFQSDLTTLEMALDTRQMNFYTNAIVDEIQMTKELEETDIKLTFAYQPSTTLITSKEIYEAATTKAKSLVNVTCNRNAKEVQKFLVDCGLWEILKGKVCYKANIALQMGALPSIYHALLEKQPVNADVFLDYVKEKIPSDYETCQKAYTAALRTLGGNLVALDWKRKG